MRFCLRAIPLSRVKSLLLSLATLPFVLPTVVVALAFSASLLGENADC